jgi:molecular chaperone GrpE
MEQENIEQQIEELKAKCDEYLNGWKRERADFINYKKEEGERISTLAKFANEELILNILPILDHLILASAHIKDEGLDMVIKQFQDFLAKEGIEPIEVAGKDFDQIRWMQLMAKVKKFQKNCKGDIPCTAN